MDPRESESGQAENDFFASAPAAAASGGPYCVENDRRCSDGGRADDRLSHGALLFIDDEASKERTMTSSTWVPPLAFDWFGFTLAGSVAAPATNASLNQIERIARSYGG